MIAVYGLHSCDTCRKARQWLAAKGIAHRFHDVRADGLEAEVLSRWIAAVGWEALLNRRSSTWRALAATAPAALDAEGAARLMCAHPALIKRPVFDLGDRVVVGFAAAQRKAIAG